MNIARLKTRLEGFGLYIRGVLNLESDEIKTLQIDADSRVSVALVGNIGSSYWPVFSQSLEYHDGKTDPLDRWSRRVAEQLAKEFKTSVVYPFTGPPYYPFQQWAKRAETLTQSPLGLMIHPRYGLWHSYRFGILINDSPVAEVETIAVASPCDSCVEQPCLHSCPVVAFSAQGYDVNSCAAYLRTTSDAGCHEQGCLARMACPVGQAYRYESAQHSFHLNAFIASR